MKNYEIHPVGYILYNDTETEITILDKFKPALLNIDKFSHILIFWTNKNNKITSDYINVPDEMKSTFKDIKKFSLTSLNLSIAKIIKVTEKSGKITIKNNYISHNAIVVDIKPYFPIEDRVKEYSIPKKISHLPKFIPDNNKPEFENTKHFSNGIDINKSLTNFEINQNGIIRKENGRCFIQLTNPENDFLNYYKNFSHIIIFWWFNRFEKDNFRKTTQCNPPYEKSPRMGVFASRSPVRPNPIGLTTARIVKIITENKTIEISDIDAFDKTPLIDIRPYIPFLNRVEKCKVPQWVDHWSDWLADNEDRSDYKNITLKESDVKMLSNIMNPIEIEKSRNIICDNKITTENTNNDFITIIGAKENNLKNVSLKIPKNKMTVITGLSGSGKTSLAFDTIYAESQRRFMDSISSTGRQFFRQFERPNVDRILNLPPAIAIEQKTISRNSRSTVGTITDINDYLRLLFAKIGIRHCPKCGRAVEPKASFEITNLLLHLLKIISFKIVSLKKNDIAISFAPSNTSNEEQNTKVLKKTIKNLLNNERGALKIILNNEEFILHTRNHCYYCDISFFELTPSFFSSNNPESMCPDCNGLGMQMNISPNLVVANPGKSILDGASEWWGNMRKFIKKPTGNWMKGEVFALAEKMKIDLETPWNELPDDFKQKALFGTDGEIVTLKYKGSNGRSGDISRPVEGAVKNIRRLFRGSHGKSSTEFYLQFMEENKCFSCQGEQLSTEARFVTVVGKRFPETAALPIERLHEWLKKLTFTLSENNSSVAGEIIKTILNKAEALINVGLPYLTINRSIQTLSGGEAQRLRLSTQLGCGLTNLLYILDEPTVGLHESDHKKLINTLKELCKKGNTIVIVEHDADIIYQADYLIDIGPGAGINGGLIKGQGTPKELMNNKDSLTGKYLSREKSVGSGMVKKPRIPYGYLTIKGSCKNNLKNINVSFPLGTFICVIGKSGSGKSSLVTKTLSPILCYYYTHKVLLKGDYDKIEGLELIDNVITITQEPIGRTPRSNPSTYTGLFDEIRTVFSSTPQAKEKKYTSNQFSFNSKEGSCESCKGEGRKKIEMNFMPDVWITCPDCKGKRFNNKILEIRYREKTIADVLEMGIDEASTFFSENEKIVQILNTLKNVGLDYLKLGQSALTLSGGEAQRIKLSKELSKIKKGKTLYILDEPTTGLHFSDIDYLLKLIHKIIDEGNTIIIIEHNVDIIKNADWIIELGPEGGEKGGNIIYEGKPLNRIINVK